MPVRNHIQGVGSGSVLARRRVLALALFCLAMCGREVAAQVDIPGPIHLTHVSGMVANSEGKPVANAEVMLVQDGAVMFKTRTNGTGDFQFDHVRGHFVFRVGRSEYAPAAREIYVGEELAVYVQRKSLYVVVGPGACMDECSSVFTSRHEFERAVRRMKRQ